MFSFAYVKDSGIREFYLGNLESWALESGIQHKESGILLMIGIQETTDKESAIQYLESGMHGVESRI